MERKWMSVVLADEAYMLRLQEHIYAHVLEDLAGCWVWQGRPNNSGYGVVSIRAGFKPTAHNLSYVVFVGEIPAGRDIDHECQVKLCVNPEHLTPRTRSDNLKRRPPGWGWAAKTECIRGHPFDEENTKIKYHPDGSFKQRACRACERTMR